MTKKNLVIFLIAMIIFIFSGIMAIVMVTSEITIIEVIEYKEILLKNFKNS